MDCSGLVRGLVRGLNYNSFNGIVYHENMRILVNITDE